MPNMRRQVRLKWAESAKPAFCAAVVHDSILAYLFNTTVLALLVNIGASLF